MLLLSGCWFLDLSLDYLFSNYPSVGVSDFKEAVSRSRPALAVSLIRPQTSALHTEWKVCGDFLGHAITKLGFRDCFLFGSNTRRCRRHHAIRHGVRIGSNLRKPKWVTELINARSSRPPYNAFIFSTYRILLPTELLGREWRVEVFYSCGRKRSLLAKLTVGVARDKAEPALDGFERFLV